MDYEIAVAGPEDKERLLEFASRNYREGSAQRDPERWDYVYGSGQYQLWFAHDSTGTVLGQAAAIPADCVAGGNDIGMAWRCNLMVSPEARGQGIATALTRAIEAEYEYCGSIGSNEASVALNLSLGWTQLPEIPRYVRIVRPTYYLARAVRPPSIRQSPRDVAIASRYRRPRKRSQPETSDDMEIRRINQFGSEVAELRDRLRPHFSFIGDRSADALNFRFLQHPVIKATALGAYLAGDIVGYIVIAAVNRDSERVGLILDWLFDPSTRETGRQLLNRGVSLLEAAGVHRIEACFEPPQLHTLLGESGFRRWSGGIQGTVNPAVFRLIGNTVGSSVLSSADSNLHEERVLSGFAEVAEYQFLELDVGEEATGREKLI